MAEKEEIKENLEELKRKLEECQKQKDEYLAGWQRARADFLNYKKEEIERIEEILKYADVGLILKILPILDNFEIAARQTFALQNKSSQEKENIDKVIQGFLQIKIQLEEFLKNQGVEEIKAVGEAFDPNLHEVMEEIEPAFAPASAEATAGKEIKSVGEKFDPNFMEVVETVEAKGKASGIVIEEIQKGYKINGRLLRPAKIKVIK